MNSTALAAMLIVPLPLIASTGTPTSGTKCGDTSVYYDATGLADKTFGPGDWQEMHDQAQDYIDAEFKKVWSNAGISFPCVTDCPPQQICKVLEYDYKSGTVTTTASGSGSQTSVSVDFTDGEVRVKCDNCNLPSAPEVPLD